MKLLGIKIDSHLIWKNKGGYSNYTHIFKIRRTKLFVLIYNGIPKNWWKLNLTEWRLLNVKVQSTLRWCRTYNEHFGNGFE